jgi:hypothetical protein
MCKKRKPTHVPFHNALTLNAVNQGLHAQGTTVYEFSINHNMDPHKSTLALLGLWDSRKGRQRRSQLIAASKAAAQCQSAGLI